MVVAAMCTNWFDVCSDGIDIEYCCPVNRTLCFGVLKVKRAVLYIHTSTPRYHFSFYGPSHLDLLSDF